ncbi:MAG TPA: response regulator [bacterium]|nr:response regulator [bacterium]HPN45131.1 response regulator [bacterium]
MLRILLVENEAIIAMGLQLKLTSRGYQVLPVARSADEAVKLHKELQPDVILMDILLSGEQTGIDAACRILADKQVPIIYITGNEHLLNDARLVNNHPLEIINKPPSDRQLFTTLEKFHNGNNQY